MAAVAVSPHYSIGGGTSRHRTPASPLRKHFSGLSSPMDRKTGLHDISEIDVDLEFSRSLPSPIPLQHHHPFSSSGAIDNAGIADNRFTGVSSMGRDLGKTVFDAQVRVERSVVVDCHTSGTDGDAEDTEGTSEDIMDPPTHVSTRISSTNASSRSVWA